MKLLNLMLVCVCTVTLNACKAETTDTKKSTTKEGSTMTTAITELQKIDTQVGSGREAEPGFNVVVHYTGWLYEEAAEGHKGKKFDSSVDRG